MALDSNLLGPFDTESTSSGSPSEDTVNPTPSKQNRRTYAHCLALIRNGALLIFNGKLKLVDKQQMTAKSGLLAEKFLKTLKPESRRRLDISFSAQSEPPFRVVDEVNQGMDPRNESMGYSRMVVYLRLVHSRMVDIACAEHPSQCSSHQGYGTPFRVVDKINQGTDPSNESMVHSRMANAAKLGIPSKHEGALYCKCTTALQKVRARGHNKSNPQPLMDPTTTASTPRMAALN
ncbi:hypothetical protein KCU74_g5561, partial [Aureobasidium melanogenum]